MQNEKDYFCENVRQCEAAMYTAAYGILKNQEDASDVMQESILKAYCSLDTLRNRKQFKPWMMRILHNTAIDFLRKNRETLALEQQAEPAAPEAAVDRETKLTVWAAVQQLKMPYRLVIILFYYQNYTVQQIADITSSPAPTVRQQLSRGRKMLAVLLHKEDFL